MSIWDYLPSSPLEWFALIARGVARSYCEAEASAQRIAVLRARMEAERGNIRQLAPMPGTTSVPSSGPMFDAVMSYGRPSVDSKSLIPEDRRPADDRQPRPKAPLSPSSVAKAAPAEAPTPKRPNAIGSDSTEVTASFAKSEGRQTADNLPLRPQAPPSPSSVANAMPAAVPTAKVSDATRNEPTHTTTSGGRAATPMPAAAVSGALAATNVSGRIQQPISKPPRVLAKPSSVAPLQVTQKQASQTQLANPVRSLNVSCTGGYVWFDSQTNVDLIGRGVVPRYKRPCLAVDIVRARNTIAQVNIDLYRSVEFLHLFSVGLLRDVEYRGQRILACDAIGQYDVGGRHVFDVLNEDLLKVAPKIASLSKSLRLRKDSLWSLPSRGAGGRSLAIRCHWGNIVCLPMIVDIDRRKNSEPVLKVHFYAWNKDDKTRKPKFCGEGYMRWHSAIVLAHCSRIGAKIALPRGGWKSVELVADVKVSSQGKEYGRGLQVRMSSLPEVVRQWVSSYPSIFCLPLSQDYAESKFDWTNAVSRLPKK